MNFGINKFYEDIDEKKNPGETKNYLIKRCEYIAEKKLKIQNNRLYYHFVNIGIQPEVVIQRWIKCLFTREFHPQDCAVIWDAIFANEITEPSGDLSYVDYFSIAMLDFISDELLRKDQNECFRRLFQYPPLESMTTLISLTSRIKPKIIETEKLEIQREKERKEQTIRNKQKLDEIAEQNKKLKKELEKMKLESDIRIQKERNKNAKENKIIKNKNLIENKRQHLEEMNQNKKSRLTLKNKNDINNLEKEFKNNYEKYVEQYKNDYLKNKEDVNNDDYILRNNLKELEDEYIKELKEKFEQEKISIKYEVETNMFKE